MNQITRKATLVIFGSVGFMKDLKALHVSTSMERFLFGMKAFSTGNCLWLGGLVDTIHHCIGCSSAIVARYWWGSVSSQGLTEVWRFPPKKTLDVAGQTEPQRHGACGKRGTFNNLVVLMFGSLVWWKWNDYRWLFGEYEPKSLTLPSPKLILNTFKKEVWQSLTVWSYPHGMKKAPGLLTQLCEICTHGKLTWLAGKSTMNEEVMSY